ncbi:MAG: PilZ domain-containing protein [Gemmatales bacterium]|nr:PilZ domain-containing protein [Gemmatales bacterium]MDW7994759.1 PilZ domain-containing protein [Gemmatales bacterium]
MATVRALQSRRTNDSATVDWARITDALIRRATVRGFLLPSEIQEELKSLGVSPRLWRNCVARLEKFLTHNNGKYYYTPATPTPRLREEERQLHIRALLQGLVQTHRRSQLHEERRAADRIEVVWPVTLTLEDGTIHRALTRDISVSGIRFLSNRSLLGQKVLASIKMHDQEPHLFSVRILWTCQVADGLYENGGTVIEIVKSEQG